MLQHFAEPLLAAVILGAFLVTFGVIFLATNEVDGSGDETQW